VFTDLSLSHARRRILHGPRQIILGREKKVAETVTSLSTEAKYRLSRPEFQHLLRFREVFTLGKVAGQSDSLETCREISTRLHAVAAFSQLPGVSCTINCPDSSHSSISSSVQLHGHM